MGRSVAPIDSISRIDKNDQINRFPYMVIGSADDPQYLKVFFSISNPTKAASRDVRTQLLSLEDVKTALKGKTGENEAIAELQHLRKYNIKLVVDTKKSDNSHWTAYYTNYMSSDPKTTRIQTSETAKMINAACTHQLGAQLPIIVFPVNDKVMIQYPEIASDQTAETFVRAETTLAELEAQMLTIESQCSTLAISQIHWAAQHNTDLRNSRWPDKSLGKFWSHHNAGMRILEMNPETGDIFQNHKGELAAKLMVLNNSFPCFIFK
ncbi:hypothetical protein PTTG_27216 [Puccinia triticina 1-1 BBBD Race 1]|uniref:Uncharacterized protein n=1 Tax=Puccinia triticina (isolate 1-1 / race 1 (BBBD)) TaxID=630390 RepID=A0A180GME9_PUCT1|nr:hypothetical protein PTTG_27216 [Puccinia triticina 1-1 BBBD Race 1]